jgi:apolipoprotein N-acyltransferase
VSAAVGIVRRRAWGRRLGLWIGGLAMFGTALVLVTWTVNALATIGPSAEALAAILIPAGMFASYAVVVGLLWPARPEFTPRHP